MTVFLLIQRSSVDFREWQKCVELHCAERLKRTLPSRWICPFSRHHISSECTYENCWQSKNINKARHLTNAFERFWRDHDEKRMPLQSIPLDRLIWPSRTTVVRARQSGTHFRSHSATTGPPCLTTLWRVTRTSSATLSSATQWTMSNFRTHRLARSTRPTKLEPTTAWASSRRTKLARTCVRRTRRSHWKTWSCTSPTITVRRSETNRAHLALAQVSHWL